MKFSVIIPVYKAGHLVETLESVTAAVDRLHGSVEVEVLCVDDEGPDGAGAVIDEYASKRPDVFKAIHQRNRGTPGARNHALELAGGDWMLFCDDDDLVRETWLETVFRVVVDHPDADLVGFDMNPFTETPDWGNGDGAVDDVNIADRISNRLVGKTVWLFAFRRDRFGDLRFDENAAGCDDLVFVCEALVRSRKCMLVARREYGYRGWAGQEMRADPSPRRLMALICGYEAMFRALSCSGKLIGGGFWYMRGNQWIETLPRLILMCLTKDEKWNQVWERWLRSMEFAAGLGLWSKWQRFVIKSIVRTRSKTVVKALCLLPERLRRKNVLRPPCGENFAMPTF